MTRASLHDGAQLQFVFPDEFNNDGRTFYPGNDPYWKAVDLHYWRTGDLEWYDPAAIANQGGTLRITLTEKQTHDLNYQGGMMSSWNQFCFTGGYIEVAVTMPGQSGVAGLWPTILSMDNLGQAGYGAGLEGMVRIQITCGRTPLTDDRRYFYSGRTPTIHVMWGPFQIKLGKGYWTFHSILATNIISVTFLTFRVNGSRVVPVPARSTLDLRMATAHLWTGLLSKSMCSRLRHRAHRVPFHSPVNGRRSMRVTNGSIRPKIWSSPTQPLRYRTCMLEGKHTFFLFSKVEGGVCVMADGG